MSLNQQNKKQGTQNVQHVSSSWNLKKKQEISLKWNKLLGFRADTMFQAKYSTVHLGVDKIATIGDKMSWDTSPKSRLFYVLWTSKGGNIAFLPHPLRAMLCPCSSYHRKQQTPQLWMEGTGEGCGFFCSLQSPYLGTMSHQFCRRLSESQKWLYVL